MSEYNPSDNETNPGEGLAALARSIGKDQGKGLPPVHLWNPDFCGDLDMRIAADGTWFYMGTPIGRKQLVKLFSSVIRYDDDQKYYLVTPVEKIGITVDDAPFICVEMAVDGEDAHQVISFRTHVDDLVTVGPDNPIRFEIEEETGGLKPYVVVRRNLEGLINRAVFYDLVALGVDHEIDGTSYFGVWSSGKFFAMSKSEELKV